jgi:hypothetical protein
VLRTSASSTAAGAAVVFNSSLIELEELLARSRVRHYVYLHKLKRRFCGVSTIISINRGLWAIVLDRRTISGRTDST